MLKILLSTTMMSLSMMMFFLNHPLSMGLMILMQTLLTCLITGMLIKTYWFSYILFLTFLGGLLVLFIYVSSIASNELFSMSYKMKMIMAILLLMSLFTAMIFNQNMSWMNFSNNSDMLNFTESFLFLQNSENKINLNKMYNSQTFLLMVMLIIYLFVTLIAIVKITNIFYGPLRPSN